MFLLFNWSILLYKVRRGASVCVLIKSYKWQKGCDNWVWKLSFLRYMTVTVFKKTIHLVNLAWAEKLTQKKMFLVPNRIVVFCFIENLCRMSAVLAPKKNKNTTTKILLYRRTGLQLTQNNDVSFDTKPVRWSYVIMSGVVIEIHASRHLSLMVKKIDQWNDVNGLYFRSQHAECATAPCRYNS